MKRVGAANEKNFFNLQTKVKTHFIPDAIDEKSTCQFATFMQTEEKPLSIAPTPMQQNVAPILIESHSMFNT
jgi:hypothetical protein